MAFIICMVVMFVCCSLAVPSSMQADHENLSDLCVGLEAGVKPSHGSESKPGHFLLKENI